MIPLPQFGQSGRQSYQSILLAFKDRADNIARSINITGF